jgi:hypothetical protein
MHKLAVQSEYTRKFAQTQAKVMRVSAGDRAVC